MTMKLLKKTNATNGPGKAWFSALSSIHKGWNRMHGVKTQVAHDECPEDTLEEELIEKLCCNCSCSSGSSSLIPQAS